jgi:uncharacterized protein YqhQ
VRRPDGTVHVECDVVEDRWPRLRRTVLRGPLALVDAFAIGMRAVRVALRESTGAAVGNDAMAALFVPVAIGVLGVFIALPGMLSSRFSDIPGDVVEAAGRAAMLVIYLAALSRSDSSIRMFGYHGAEHMSIAAFERHRRMPEASEVWAESPVHVRCGTDFVSLLVITCGVVYSFVPRDPVWAGGLLRVALLPVVAAVAYEVMRACAARPASVASRVVTLPGRALQRITTRRPDGGQVEVAMAALEATLTT